LKRERRLWYVFAVMTEATTPAAHRIARLVITELFGPGEPTIDIAFKLEQHVTVLHGRNGSGKTITLTLLDALRNGRFGVLAQYPFTLLRLERDDGTSLEIEPTGEQKTSEAERHLNYRLDDLEWTSLSVDEEDEEGLWARTARSRKRRRSQLHGAQRSQGNLFEYIFRDQHRTLFEWLDSLPPIKFIKADRLFARGPKDLDDDDDDDDETEPKLMVERLSEDLRAHIHEADRQYRRISTRLDSSLPSRLFADHDDLPELEELEARERALNAQTDRLTELGLLRQPPSSIDRNKLTEEQKKTFFIILNDREEKLATFTPIADKAQRLITSLKRKLAPKTVRLDVENGYTVTTANGNPLPLRCLSSGEQHEFVLLHELLFDVQPGSLILIDEPELSLHVTWQVDVLPELLDIAKLANVDMVIATHSPYIVGDHHELLVSLGQPV